MRLRRCGAISSIPCYESAHRGNLGALVAIAPVALTALVLAWRSPRRFIGTPGEGADLIGFRASTQVAYITGQIISINGGILLR